MRAWGERCRSGISRCRLLRSRGWQCGAPSPTWSTTRCAMPASRSRFAPRLRRRRSASKSWTAARAFPQAKPSASSAPSRGSMARAPVTAAPPGGPPPPPRGVATPAPPPGVGAPPLSVAVAPDESIALVTAAMRIEGGKQVPDNKVSVIDLQSSPPRVIATLEAGAGVAGISINRQGSLALAANRSEGTVSVFTINGRTGTAAGKVRLGDEKSAPSHVALTPDGRTGLVTRDGDHRISVLSIRGSNVEYTKRDLYPGQRPYGIDVCAPGRIAVVANIGVGQGDEDTISVIDLQASPPRVIDTVTVGQTPEGILCSPDGRKVAVNAMSGSNKPQSSPFYRANGL